MLSAPLSPTHSLHLTHTLYLSVSLSLYLSPFSPTALTHALTPSTASRNPINPKPSTTP